MPSKKFLSIVKTLANVGKTVTVSFSKDSLVELSTRGEDGVVCSESIDSLEDHLCGVRMHTDTPMTQSFSSE